MKFSLKRFRDDNCGAILAETAIVLPMMLLLLAAAAEFGRLYYTYNTLSKATRVSARYISSRCLFSDNITEAENLAVYGNTAGTGTAILPNLTTANVVVNPTSGTPETITVSIDNYTYQPLLPLGGIVSLVNLEIDPSTTIKYLVTTPIVGGCV